MINPNERETRGEAENVASEDSILFMAHSPHQIQADWGGGYWAQRLAGFPLNLLYTSIRRTEAGNRVVCCCYWFDPGSYTEDGAKRKMVYLPRLSSPYRLVVEYHKNDAVWRTLKYKDEQLVTCAQGPEF